MPCAPTYPSHTLMHSFVGFTWGCVQADAQPSAHGTSTRHGTAQSPIQGPAYAAGTGGQRGGSGWAHGITPYVSAD